MTPARLPNPLTPRTNVLFPGSVIGGIRVSSSLLKKAFDVALQPTWRISGKPCHRQRCRHITTEKENAKPSILRCGCFHRHRQYQADNADGQADNDMVPSFHSKINCVNVILVSPPYRHGSQTYGQSCTQRDTFVFGASIVVSVSPSSPQCLNSRDLLAPAVGRR
jgi:hypothetical protein